jgi:hypothetical protein
LRDFPYRAFAGGQNDEVSAIWPDDIIGGGAVLATVGIAWLALARDAMRRWRSERWATRRARQAEAASIEASLELEAFAPEKVREAVHEILALATAVWTGTDEPILESRADAGVIRAWALSHGSDTGTHVDGRPRVDLLRVVNRAGETEDRVSVRVRGRVHQHHASTPLGPHTVRFDERWTLGRDGEGWELLEFDADPLASELLRAQVIPAEWADQERLGERSLAELAHDDHPGVLVSELADDDVPPYGQLLDLSVVDGRFVPLFVQSTLRHLIDAWEQATIASDEGLSLRVSPEAYDQLLHPRGGNVPTRLVLRDATLRAWKPTGVEVRPDPARIVIFLRVSAVRYLINTADGTHLAGSLEYHHEIRLHWTLELTESAEVPWRLVASSNPATDMPGTWP